MMKQLMTFIKIFIKGFRQYKEVGGIANLTIAQVQQGSVLKGRKAIITGGSDGIGLAMAKKFLSEGAEVLIVGRNMDKLNRAKCDVDSNMLHILQWDVTDFAAMDAKFAEAVSILGGVDLFVNNAAYIPVSIGSEDDWDRTIDTNMKATFFLCRAAAEHYLQNSDGRCCKIINVSSLNSIQSAPNPYFISKSGVDAITRGFAIKYAPHNVVVNGIAPGFCASSINYQDVSQNAFNRLSANKRIITPTEIAELACFLASDAANGIVGQTIFCDGGATL